MAEEATATIDEVQQQQQQQQQQQCNKPFCAVYAVENGHHLNKLTTRRRGGGRSDDIHFQYDQNSYLSVGRTLNNIFGSAGGDERSANDGVGAEDGQDNEMGPAAAPIWRQTNHGDGQQRRLESLSPTFVRTALTHCQHTDWDLLREVRVRELTEVRQRVTLMENTMRWWLSAAEQWREKWLKVKNERSRLREENLRLRKALSNAKVELHGLKKSSDGSIIAQSPKGICCAETRCRLSPAPPKTVVVIPPMCEKIVHKENTDCTSNSSKRRRRRSSSV